MKVVNKISLLTTLVLGTIVLFASCSEKKETVVKEEKPKEVVISFWGFPNFTSDDGVAGNFEKSLIAAFEAKNPGIKVKFELLDYQGGPAKVETAIASRNAPDVIYDAPGRIIRWGDSGLLADLADILKSQESTIPASMITASKGADGKIYMYPVHTTPFSTAFNKQMLEDLGVLDLLPYKRGDRTWTLKEYETLLKAIKEKLPRGSTTAAFFCKGQGGDQGTRAFLANLHGDAWLLNKTLTEYTFNSENAVANLNWTVKAIKDGLLYNGSDLTAGDAIDMYVTGKAAHTILYSPQLNKLKDGTRSYKGKDFDSIYMPFPNDTGKPVLEFIVGGPCVFNNGDSAKIEAAKKFVKFMATDAEWASKVIAATGAFPASSSVKIAITNPEIKYNSEVLPKFYGQYYNTIKGFAEMRGFWFPALQAAINGVPSQEVLNKFVKEANATLK